MTRFCSEFSSIRELGVIVANRRQPHLDQAMGAVEVFLRSSSDSLDAQFLDSLNHGLHHLRTELDYRFWDDGNSQFDYSDTPVSRFREGLIRVFDCFLNLQPADIHCRNHRNSCFEIIRRASFLLIGN